MRKASIAQQIGRDEALASSGQDLRSSIKDRCRVAFPDASKAELKSLFHLAVSTALTTISKEVSRGQ